LGTVHYMSPEQAQGKSVDARSDIFSFGVVLYEMLSARKAFHGENAISIMAAILHMDPPAGVFTMNILQTGTCQRQPRVSGHLN
jgi:serine/threonine protein kinase